jgi:hypothetical protein
MPGRQQIIPEPRSRKTALEKVQASLDKTLPMLCFTLQHSERP